LTNQVLEYIPSGLYIMFKFSSLYSPSTSITIQFNNRFIASYPYHHYIHKTWRTD